MSQGTPGSLTDVASENHAPSPASGKPASTAPPPKRRSCVTCRQRKVRCDRESPCSNCRQAGIACIFPTPDRKPRWARRLERMNNNAAVSSGSTRNPDPATDKVMDRLRNLENLVKELSGQLEQAHAANSSASGASSQVHSPDSSGYDRTTEHQGHASLAANIDGVNKQFGRLVVKDPSRSHYVSSGFWSRVDDELDGLKVDAQQLAGDVSDSSEDGEWPEPTSQSNEIERTPLERNSFLFKHSLSSGNFDLGDFHPLPSQVPFLVETFSENVNIFVRIVHIPSMNKIVRDLRHKGVSSLTPSHEALMFSIYYAGITSMEDEDVVTNFGSSKAELSLKYRSGLEHALVKADFLNRPDLILVQAFAIFVTLARRHDSPRFIWMMTGLVIRMAQYLGLQRDGSHFPHLTPFEIEMRRRTWWCMCIMDLRASEDQGTELSITKFDTKIPLNINDEDIDPESKQMPSERYGMTDMTFPRVNFEINNIMMNMTTTSTQGGMADLESQSQMLNEIYQKVEQGYLQHAEEFGNIRYWVAVTITRLIMAKMALIVFLPVLFSAPSEHISDEIRTRLFISAIEVAEYNHALNAEQACRQWRWIFQTHTHWHSIVYLLIEVSRRPLSPTVERAWVALHSTWLLPARNTNIDKNLRIWVPLRSLMAKARKHRNAEIIRLRSNPQAAAQVEAEDENTPIPSSSGPFTSGSSVNHFRERWRQLVDSSQPTETKSAQPSGSSDRTTSIQQPVKSGTPLYTQVDAGFNQPSKSGYLGTNGQQPTQSLSTPDIGYPEPTIQKGAPTAFSADPTYAANPDIAIDWSDVSTMGTGFVPWLFDADDPTLDGLASTYVNSMDANMDLSETNWYNWVETAKGMEMDMANNGTVFM